MSEDSAPAFITVPDGSRTPGSVRSGRLIVTGVDASGRSCAERNGPVDLAGVAGFEGILFSVLYDTQINPSLPGAGRAAGKLDLGVAAGALNWKVIEYAPGVAFSMHHTDTIDLDFVLAGSVHLILDDGEHPLQAGDSAVVTGVDHAWRTGPDGCRMSVICVGVTAGN